MVNENSAMLSNQEVYSLLCDIQSGTRGHRKPSKNQPSMATITYEAIKYLEKTPCAQYKADIIPEFMIALQSFNLTKAEKIQLLNICPTTAVEIQILIEESEERLTEDQIYELLAIISKFMPKEEEEGEGEGEEEEMEGEDGEGDNGLEEDDT